MADVYSSGYTNDNATPPVKHMPNQGGGRVRYYYDTYVQGVADGNIGDVIHFKKLPGGARPLPGSKMFNSVGAGAGGATLAIGISGTAAKFLAATNIDALGSALMEAVHASGGTYETPAGEIEVIGTNAVAPIKAGQVITLHFLYVID